VKQKKFDKIQRTQPENLLFQASFNTERRRKTRKHGDFKWAFIAVLPRVSLRSPMLRVEQEYPKNSNSLAQPRRAGTKQEKAFVSGFYESLGSKI
jgi:hypothetical protein